MFAIPDLPGSPHHQMLLQRIADHYAQDERILAVLLFGSLAHGTWDEFSDIDLSVVIQDGVQFDMPQEIGNLSKAIAGTDNTELFTEVAGNQGFVVLESLHAIALDYNPLRAVNRYILGGFRILVGDIAAESIRNAAAANDRPERPLSQRIHQALWLALGTSICLQRKHVWRAYGWMQPMRDVLLEIFASTHNGKRAFPTFESDGSVDLKAALGRTLPHYFPGSPDDTLHSFHKAFSALLDVIEYHLVELSNGQGVLGTGEQALIQRLRARQAPYSSYPSL